MNKKQAMDLLGRVQDLYCAVSEAANADPAPDPATYREQFNALVTEAEAGLGKKAPFGQLVASKDTPISTELLGLDAVIGQLARWIRGEAAIKGGVFRIVKDADGHLQGD